MTRTVQPHEILISVCIFIVLAVGLFSGGYWAGHRGVDDLQFNYNQASYSFNELYDLANEEGWVTAEEPMRINVECHNDASDWATIRTANEIGFNADVPVFVHGSCLTHEVVEVPSITLKGGMLTCSGNMTAYECGEYVKKKFDAELINTRYCDSDTGKCSDGTRIEVINVPKPEGR